jgi:hypothetical protein
MYLVLANQVIGQIESFSLSTSRPSQPIYELGNPERYYAETGRVCQQLDVEVEIDGFPLLEDPVNDCWVVCLETNSAFCLEGCHSDFPVSIDGDMASISVVSHGPIRPHGDELLMIALVGRYHRQVAPTKQEEEDELEAILDELESIATNTQLLPLDAKAFDVSDWCDLIEYMNRCN